MKKVEVIKKWLLDNYGDLEIYETDDFPKCVFYVKDSKIIFEYDQSTHYVDISYGEIWSFLESVFVMDNDEVQDVTKDWVVEHYKLKVNSTYGYDFHNHSLLNKKLEIIRDGEIVIRLNTK